MNYWAYALYQGPDFSRAAEKWGMRALAPEVRFYQTGTPLFDR
jgi:hypothetical protein